MGCPGKGYRCPGYLTETLPLFKKNRHQTGYEERASEKFREIIVKFDCDHGNMMLMPERLG